MHSDPARSFSIFDSLGNTLNSLEVFTRAVFRAFFRGLNTEGLPKPPVGLSVAAIAQQLSQETGEPPIHTVSQDHCEFVWPWLFAWTAIVNGEEAFVHVYR